MYCTTSAMQSFRCRYHDPSKSGTCYGAWSYNPVDSEDSVTVPLVPLVPGPITALVGPLCRTKYRDIPIYHLLKYRPVKVLGTAPLPYPKRV